ncbi:MAG: CbtA family protein [Actinomycetota bacterium]
MAFSTVIKRALIAGAAVGVVLAAYLVFFVEPVIDDAIALEEALAAEAEPNEGTESTHSHDDEEALFTRDEQVLGGGVASVIYAMIFAAIFGTVFAATRHRLPGMSDFARSIWLAAVAFATVSLLPALKYPATPPAVGDPDTVEQRTAYWLILVAVSVVVAWALVKLSSRLRASGIDDTSRVAIVTVSTVVAYAIVLLVLPANPDEIDPAVPAALVWDFRLRSLGGLALTWAGIGIGLGWLLQRVTGAEAASVAPEKPAAVG